jgi:hypothetical protein
MEFARVVDAVRRAKQIAAVYPNATVDIFRGELPVFSLGASWFGGAGGTIPHRCYSEFMRINELTDELPELPVEDEQYEFLPAPIVGWDVVETSHD